MTVQFLRPYGSYATGSTATFSADTEAALVQQGIASVFTALSTIRNGPFDGIEQPTSMPFAVDDQWQLSRGLVRTVVGNNCHFPNGSATAGSTQYMSRTLLWCPAGAASMALYFSGVRVATTVETDLTGASPCNISYAVIPGFVWDPAVRYNVGDTVIWYAGFATNSNNPLFRATTNNVNSVPGPGSSDWTAADPVVTQQCTVKAQVTCGAKTTTKADGSTVTEGWFETDPFQPLGATGPCFIEVRVWVQNGGGLSFTDGQTLLAGSYMTSAATTPDLTVTGFGTAAPVGGTAVLRPSLATGVPAIVDSGKTAAILGHSIAHGTCCGQSVINMAIVSGGTGYTTADIGKRFTISNTGGTAFSTGFTASGVIMNVTAGAVAAIRVDHGGSYANSGQPTGTQTTTAAPYATVGTGLTVSLTYGAGGLDVRDKYFGQSYIEKGLNAANIRSSGFTCPGDTIDGWVTRDYSRMAMIQRGRFSSAIIHLWINSITNGRTYAQMVADASYLLRQLRGLGIQGLYPVTETPASSSTDGFATLVNQTTVSAPQDIIRWQFNTWIRNGCDGLADGYFDYAAIMEDGGITNPTGKFVVNGNVGYATIDGKHPSPQITPLLTEMIRSRSGILK